VRNNPPVRKTPAAAVAAQNVVVLSMHVSLFLDCWAPGCAARASARGMAEGYVCYLARTEPSGVNGQLALYSFKRV
jgi:hypothetical protein